MTRRSHPETSREAARELVRSGSFGRRCLFALDILRQNPGSTSHELDACAGVSDGEIRKRLSDLRKAGLAVVGRSRKCKVKGSQCQTWWPADHPEAESSDTDVSERWSRFWQAYPRKSARKAAEFAFFKLNPDAELFESMMSALEKQKKVWKDHEFIPHASTWINGERWEDELTASGAYVKTMAEKMAELKGKSDG